MTRPFAPPAGNRAAAAVQVAAALLWLPQAALLAAAVGGIAAGGGPAGAPMLVAGVLGLGLLRAALDGVGNRLAFRRARSFLSDARARAVAAVAGRSPLDAGRPASGQVASILGEQAEAIVPYLARFRPARLKAVVIPAAILLCVLPLSWAAALVLLLAAPLIPVFMALIGWRAQAASKAQLAEVGSMNGILLDRLRGLATIRALGAVDATARRFREQAESLRARTMAVLRIAFLSSAVLELFAALGIAMVAVYVGFHLLGDLGFGAWGRRLTLAEGLFVLLLAPAFFEPLRDLSSVWHDRAAGEAALAALQGLDQAGLALPGAADAAPPPSAGPADAPSLRVEGLRFGHGGGAIPVFAGFDLDVRPGEHVALLGPSGSGKSTLLALVAGLAPADGGRIVIGGTVLAPGTAAGLRARMAWIGQRPHIFTGSLAGNVAMGRPGLGWPQVDAALRVAALGDVAARHRGLVGEGGAGLSGGEALRLALARAAANRDAGLILADEPTAHLDATTAAAVMDDLLGLAAGRTLVVATHDPVLAARMDRVVRLGAALVEGIA